jgi:phosphoglycerol transferase
LWVLSRFSTQAGLIENVFLLLSFPLTALAAYGAMRGLGVRRAAAVVPAILFALIPYHFARGPYGHLMLAEYSSVAVGLYLALAVMLDRPLFARRASGRRWLEWTSGRTLATLALCAWVASGGIYYAAFSLFCLAVALVARLVAGGRARPTLVTVVTVTAAIGAVLLVNQWPVLSYQRENGTNALTGARTAAESEQNAFKLTQFLLPSPSHRIERLGQPAREYDVETTSRGEGPSWPGTLPLLGLALGLAALAARALRERRPEGLLGDARLSAAGVLAIALGALGTLGGGGAIIAWTLDPSIRAWNRMSILLGFLGVLGLAVLLERALRGRTRVVLAAALAAVLAVGFLDQTSPAQVPDYAAARDEWSNDARFVAQIERDLGGTGEVYQLPYVAFPESPPTHKMLDYSLLKGYLHAGPELRWSYGAMRGRPEDWQFWLSQQPFDVQVRAAAATGFDGIWVDTFGYPEPPVALGPLTRLSAGPPLVSGDGRLAFFDVRAAAARIPEADRAAIRRATLDPVQVTFGEGFSLPAGDATRGWRTVALSGTWNVAVQDRPRRVRVRAEIASATPGPVTLSLDGREVARGRATRGGRPFAVTVTVPPGAHALTVAGSNLTLFDPAVTAAELIP